jgi:hypothetical protein
MILMKNHLQPWAFSRCQGATSRTLRTPGPIYRLQWLVAGTLKVQGFLGKGSNRLMDEASTNRNFFVSVYDGHSTRFHTERCQNTVASNQRWDSQNNSTGIYWKFRWTFWWNLMNIFSKKTELIRIHRISWQSRSDDHPQDGATGFPVVHVVLPGIMWLNPSKKRCFFSRVNRVCALTGVKSIYSGRTTKYTWNALKPETSKTHWFHLKMWWIFGNHDKTRRQIARIVRSPAAVHMNTT